MAAAAGASKRPPARGPRLLLAVAFVAAILIDARLAIGETKPDQSEIKSQSNMNDGNFGATNATALLPAFRSHVRRDAGAHQEPLDDSQGPHFEPLTNGNQQELASGGQQEAEAQKQQQQRGKRTLYACEERQLDIECLQGEQIHLIRANYGRFSIQICNEHGQLDWKVNCMSPTSFQLIADSCQARQSCQLLASNTVFGDPCPGTQKYLEVHYSCRPAALKLNQTQSAPTLALRPSFSKPNVITEEQPVMATSERPSGGQQQFPRWPTWMPTTPPTTEAQPAPPQAPRFVGLVAANQNNGSHHCPELVWRQVRWPTTEAGLTVLMPCPAHALGPPYAASLACSPSGQWATRSQAPQCQSIWLRELTKQLETGDSPLAQLGELARRTRTNGLPGALLAPSSGSLFGNDLLQVAQLVRRLVDELDELLNRILDEKQRLVFAREVVQSLAELANNLAGEHHLEAWLELAAIERQRVAGQLLQSLQTATNLLASMMPVTNEAQSGTTWMPNYHYQQSFLKLTEQVYLGVMVQPLPADQANASLELSLPRTSSLLGTRWLEAEQRFTLHLQASRPAPATTQAQTQAPAQVDVKYPQDEQAALKIVLAMVRGLGAHLEPLATEKLVVNSDIVGLSIVADARQRAPAINLQFSAPVELVFRHLVDLVQAPARRPICAYWDAGQSTWLREGCRLVATNRTHSSCACEHLISPHFALLAELDQLALASAPSDSVVNGQPLQRSRVQLDGAAEGRLLALGENKLLHLAKLQDGHLFHEARADNYNLRLLIYLSCLISAALLAIQLAATAYNQAQARRLLGSIPRHPPPPLLVTSSGHHQPPSSQLSNLRQDALLPPGGGVGGDYGNHQATGYRLQLPWLLVLQLLALQLLLVLLVESQNYLQQSAAISMDPSELFQEWHQQQYLHQYQPLGWPTWTLVLLLYYLITSVTCWLLSQLARLNLEILIDGNSGSPNSSSGSLASSAPSSDTKSFQYGPVANSQSSNGLYGGRNLYAASCTVYGGATSGQQQTNPLAASISPSSSFSSSAAEPHLSGALSRLEADSARLYGYRHQGSPLQQQQCSSSVLMKLAAWLQHQLSQTGCLQVIVVQLILPAAFVSFIGWPATSGARQFNERLYTLSKPNQLAYWPLLIEASAPSAAILVLYGPAVFLALIALAVILARRQQAKQPQMQSRQQLQQQQQYQHQQQQHQQQQQQQQTTRSIVNPYGSAGNMATGGSLAAASLMASGQLFLPRTQQQDQQHQELGDGAKSSKGQQRPTRRQPPKEAKLLLATLAALAALHSLCWWSFFMHVNFALHAPADQVHGRLVWLFAGSNLALVLLLIWSQRRQTRRACQLAGLARLVKCGGSSRKANGGGSNQPPAFYSGAGKPLALSQQQQQLKGSPSQQSLFLISQARQQQQQPIYGSNYQQQHLYQQLQGHIYDSAGDMAAAAAAASRCHPMQPMAPQVEPLASLQLQMGLNRSLNANLHQAHHQHQFQGHHHQTQQRLNTGHKTLQRPNGEHSHHPAASNNSGKLTGEVDGPLVALSSLMTPASGHQHQPLPSQPTAATFAAQHHHHHQQHHFPSTEHQLFSHQRQDQPSLPADANRSNQHQCQQLQTSSNNQQQLANRNYTEALRLAMAEQSSQSSHSQSNESSGMQHHHFRRAHSNSQSNHKQQLRQQQQQLQRPPAMIDRPDCGGGLATISVGGGGPAQDNIYDVANYAIGQ